MNRYFDALWTDALPCADPRALLGALTAPRAALWHERATGRALAHHHDMIERLDAADARALLNTGALAATGSLDAEVAVYVSRERRDAL